MAICPRPKRRTPHDITLNQRPAKRGLSNEKNRYGSRLYATEYLQVDVSRFDAACLMNIPAFVRNKSQSSTFKNIELWWWLDRLPLGL